jgi:hypothetical protein
MFKTVGPLLLGKNGKKVSPWAARGSSMRLFVIAMVGKVSFGYEVGRAVERKLADELHALNAFCIL